MLVLVLVVLVLVEVDLMLVREMVVQETQHHKQLLHYKTLDLVEAVQEDLRHHYLVLTVVPVSSS